MAFYQSFNKKWWRGRVDGKSWPYLRWHQVVKPLDFQRVYMSGVALLGFSCDEGVRRNQGRPGAVEGPAYIQKAMSDLPVHAQVPIYDAGNVLCDNEDLEAAQKLLALKVSEIHRTGCLPIVLGGGHEMAWGHFQGLIRAYPDSNIGIINIDAHFDLKESEQGSSGTPFRQIADFQENRNGAFNYMVIGVGRHANTRASFDTADRLGVRYFLDSETVPSNQERLLAAVGEMAGKVDMLYLTIDMDVFNVAHSPGVSAQNVAGISADRTVPDLLNAVIATGKLKSVDIAEVNPKFDPDRRTARLAAYLVFQMVEALEG